MTEQYDSRLSSARALAVALTPSSSSLALTSAPSGPPLNPGTYRLRIDAEILTGDYAGAGLVFTNLQRGLEGSTAATHRATVTVRHVITGESLNALRSSARAQALQSIDPRDFVRSAGVRAYLGANFT